LDPRESKNQGAAFTEGARMLIMAASNNASHFGATRKVTPNYARILSIFSDEELKVAIPFMIENQISSVLKEEILERAKIVGNLPRYILTDSNFNDRQRETSDAIIQLQHEEVKEILTFNGLSRSGSTIAGCIFAVSVNLNPQEEESTDSGEASDKTDDQWILLERVGYDGYLVPDFGAMLINLLSKAVLRRICELNRNYILSFWGITSAGGRSVMGEVVEDLFWDDLKKAYKMRTYLMRKEKNTKLEELLLDVGKCHHIEDVSLNELGDKVFHVDASTIARMRKNEALIDFAGPHCNVYQVTVSNDHGMSLNGLEKVFKASGHYNDIEGDAKQSNQKLGDKLGKISYYWVVPNERESVWKGKAPKKIRKEQPNESVSQRKRRTEVASLLEKYVNQYILVMDNVPIESKEIQSNKIHPEQYMHVTDDLNSTIMEQNIAKLEKYTVRELRRHCDVLKLKQSGTKTALILRLLPYVDSIR
jgi:hypothetical protein